MYRSIVLQHANSAQKIRFDNKRTCHLTLILLCRPIIQIVKDRSGIIYEMHTPIESWELPKK